MDCTSLALQVAPVSYYCLRKIIGLRPKLGNTYYHIIIYGAFGYIWVQSHADIVTIQFFQFWKKGGGVILSPSTCGFIKAVNFKLFFSIIYWQYEELKVGR